MTSGRNSELAFRQGASSSHSPARNFPSDTHSTIPLTPVSGICALEDASFPFETISKIAEAESWRKEIYRPSNHIHKWWARRLGSVFRAIVIGTFAPTGADVLDLFYKPVRINDSVVFDPFMGSGTTIGEVVKVGGRAIGRDINPVACFLVRNATATHDREAILSTCSEIERDVSEQYYGSTPEWACTNNALIFFVFVKAFREI